MHTIRELLDFLADESLESIRRLCELRDLGGRGKNAKCESLARSYRGDYGQFFEDLLKQDLVRLVASPTEVDGNEYWLRSAGQYAKDELIAMAIKLFRNDEVPKLFELCDSDADFDDDEVDEDEDDDAARDDVQGPRRTSNVHERNRKTARGQADRARNSQANSIKIFVSHSSKDETLAQCLVNCLESCIEVPDQAIRCTSVPGYKLLPGDVSDEVLRANLAQCSIVIGLLTNASLNSGYVIMELGAAWGLQKATCALLSPEIDVNRIPGPLAKRHAIRINADHDITSLMEVIAETASLSMRNRARCTAGVNAFLASSREITTAGPSNPAAPAFTAHHFTDADAKLVLRNWIETRLTKVSTVTHPFHELDSQHNFAQGTTKRVLPVVVQDLGNWRIESSESLFTLKFVPSSRQFANAPERVL